MRCVPNGPAIHADRCSTGTPQARFFMTASISEGAIIRGQMGDWQRNRFRSLRSIAQRTVKELHFHSSWSALPILSNNSARQQPRRLLVCSMPGVHSRMLTPCAGTHNAICAGQGLAPEGRPVRTATSHSGTAHQQRRRLSTLGSAARFGSVAGAISEAESGCEGKD